MPTLFWLVDPELSAEVSRLESVGGVRRLEAEVDPLELARAHEAYAARREELVERHELPQPSGGVGGTRRGLKCLHAHLAACLAGTDDPVGERILDELGPVDVVVVEDSQGPVAGSAT